MGKYASKVVEQAKAWLGYKESDGTHKQIIDLYNAQKPLPVGYKVTYTDAWCATFVSAVAVKLGYTDIIPPECSCLRMIDLFKAKGIWVEDESRTPNAGDIVFYDWQDNGVGDNKGGADHVGIVEKVENGKITVIEGNYSKSVKRRTISVNAKQLRGYGVPKYDAEPTAEVEPTAPTTTKSIDELAKEVIIGKHGSGKARKESLGSLYNEVQARVNEMLAEKTEKTEETTRYHVVVRGDTLWGIAKQYLGDGGRYPEIVKLNGLKSTVIFANQRLKIPKK